MLFFFSLWRLISADVGRGMFTTENAEITELKRSTLQYDFSVHSVYSVVRKRPLTQKDSSVLIPWSSTTA